jgi:hypothetical protein
MGLTMRERKAVTREAARRYGRAKKQEKGRMLDELGKLTGYNRCYLARMLRAGGKGMGQERKSRDRKARSRDYGTEVLRPLKKLWAIMDSICSKRLKAILPGLIDNLERFGELRLPAEVKAQLKRMSASTIDRLLAPERRRMQLKRRSGTKPGSLLKGAIPVRTFAEWDGSIPGFMEIDLVGHDGGEARGEFIQTLNMVDVFSGWTETRAVKNKAQLWVFEALKEIRTELPFPLLGIDSDNGAEFINAHLLHYCQEEGISFTRSRPYRKNDSCHVEQKNWTVVRRAVGYARFEGEEQLEILNRLYDLLRLYTNFFQPSMKLVEKTREGSKVIKRYDQPKTPYQRLLDFGSLQPEQQQRLASLYSLLNPAQLQRRISSLQDKLNNYDAKQPRSITKEVHSPTDFEYILAEATI